MKDLYEKLDNAAIRISKIILLAGMLNDGEALAEPLSDLLEKEDDKTLLKCFPDMPAAMLDDRENKNLFQENFMDWAFRTGKLGFVLQFDRPVMRHADDGRSASYSWSYYSQHLAYGDTLDEAVAKGLEWAHEREELEKAKVAHPNAHVKKTSTT